MPEKQIVIVAEEYSAFNVLAVPPDVDVHRERERWLQWRREEYIPSLDTETPLPTMFFDDWLIRRCGARYAVADKDVIIVRE